jgi:hypothetical protein
MVEKANPNKTEPLSDNAASERLLLPPTVVHLIAGGVAGTLAKTIVAPLDRVKILFQVNNPHFAYEGIVGTLRKIVRTEGVLHLWRGNSATIARFFPYAAIQFMSYEKYKALLVPGEVKHPHPFLHLICGALAGATATIFTYPLDLMRARLASEVRSRTYRNVVHGLVQMYHKEGLYSWFKGMSPTLQGILPYAGVNFATYETLKYYAPKKKNGELSSWWKLVCGGIAGAVGQTVSYPWDVIRRRRQIHGFSTYAPAVSFEGSWHAMKCLVQTEGWRSLYRYLVATNSRHFRLC